MHVPGLGSKGGGVLSGVDFVSVCDLAIKKALTLTEFLKHFARPFFYHLLFPIIVQGL